MYRAQATGSIHQYLTHKEEWHQPPHQIYKSKTSKSIPNLDHQKSTLQCFLDTFFSLNYCHSCRNEVILARHGLSKCDKTECNLTNGQLDKAVLSGIASMSRVRSSQ